MRLAAVLLVCSVFLGWGISAVPVTGALTDPVGGIRAQDEALYANGALDFAARGDWLTPRFLGRYLLYKPPLAAWLAGLSLRLFGVSLWALRLPFLLSAVAAALFVFIWLRQARNEPAAWGALLLLLGSASWQAFAKLAYTDVLVALSATAALYVWQRDPDFLQARTAPLAGFAIAAGILAKSIAGFIPWMAIGLAIALRRGAWSSFLRLTGWTVLFAAPWHLYQLAVHREWFWSEYIERQILAFGAKGVTVQVREDSHWLFYGKRALRVDPFLWFAGLSGTLMLWRKRSEPASLAVVAWLTTGLVALFAFRYRNLQYVVPLLPALALGAALALPVRLRHLLWVAALPLLLLSRTPPPDAPAFGNVRAYAALGRGNPLVMVDSDDEFYAAVQPLAKVHYFFVDPADAAIDYAPQYLALGITMRAAEFQDLGAHWQKYRAALHSAGLDSTEPIATAVVTREESDVLRTVSLRLDCDYYLPARYEYMPPPPSHERRAAQGGRVFWLSRQVQHRPAGWLRIPAGTRW